MYFLLRFSDTLLSLSIKSATLFLTISLSFIIILFFPMAYAVLVICAFSYYFQHRWMHQTPSYARENAPWHYDHHMGRDQHANWGVRLPIFDYVFGSRKVYKGGKKERIKFILHKHNIQRQLHEIRSRRDNSEKY